MKNYFIAGLCLMTFSILTNSCENSSENDDLCATTSIKVPEGNIIDLDSLISESNRLYASWERSPQVANKMRATSTDYTVYGYTSTSTSGAMKVLVGYELAKRMGISSQTYIAEFVTAEYLLTINGLNERKVRFSTNDSPKCGLYPDYTKDEFDLRGYSVLQKGNNVTMATKMIHVISDLGGRSYNMWFPCQPSQLEWCYNIFTTD